MLRCLFSYFAALRWGMALLGFLMLPLLPLVVHAGALTPGNLVVVRVGTGAATLTSVATAVFLDEYTPGGTFVQSVALPIVASGSQKALTLAGSAATEGGLNLSVNGHYLVLGGYDAAPGLLAVSTTAASTVNRVVARIDANGNVDTSVLAI